MIIVALFLAAIAAGVFAFEVLKPGIITGATTIGLFFFAAAFAVYLWAVYDVDLLTAR